MDEALLLTVNQAATRLGIGRSFLYDLMLRGELQSVKLGRARRIPVAALEKFIGERLEASDGS